MTEQKFIEILGAMLDEKLEQKLEEKLEQKLDEKLEPVIRRLDAIEQRMDAIEQRMDAIEQRMDAIEQRIDVIERRMDVLEHKVEALEQNAESVEQDIKQLNIRLGGMNEQMKQMVEWIVALEQKVKLSNQQFYEFQFMVENDIKHPVSMLCENVYPVSEGWIKNERRLTSLEENVGVIKVIVEKHGREIKNIKRMR